MDKLGTIYGVGVGPGDVDLLSVKAYRLVRGAKHVAFFRKAGRAGHARKIVAPLLDDDVIEFPMEYPVTTEIPVSDQRYGSFYLNFMKIAVITFNPYVMKVKMLLSYARVTLSSMAHSCIFMNVSNKFLLLRSCQRLRGCQQRGQQQAYP